MGVAATLLLPHLLGEDFATRKAARLYAPAAGEAYGSGNRDAITVALIDDATLEDAHENWPPNYGYYARVLRGLAVYKPKAIFFDIAFRDLRENDRSIFALLNEICALKRAGIPVYLASQPTADGALTTIAPVQALEGRCLTQVGVTYTADEIDHIVWEYPLASYVGKKEIRSAAMTLYEDVTGERLPDPAARMALTWGLHPAQDALTWIAASEPTRPDGASDADQEAGSDQYCRKDHGWMELAPPGIHRAKFADAEKPVCVFHHTVYVYELKTDPTIGSKINHKIVLLGTARRFGGDYINSPISGRIPGVYLHAMALDNLLTYGANYKRVTSLSLTSDTDNLKLLLLTVSSLVAVSLIRVVKNRVRRRRARHKEIPRRYRSYPSQVHLLATAPTRETEIQPVLMVWPQAVDEDDVSWRHVLGWLAHRAIDAVRWCAKSTLNLLLSVVLVLGVLIVGQHFLNVGFLTVVDVAAFALAAEWLEWNEQLLEWLTHSETERNEE
ncbi:CHASE2 domain-containing protein [Paraburkholderia bengalensis]|uniref:CHASE2 domain-containing protein n=1 Tax=Paraburkholderia bengalensis TaxID=2747562 RepID=A0ABU8IL86_9BURK